MGNFDIYIRLKKKLLFNFDTNSSAIKSEFLVNF